MLTTLLKAIKEKIQELDIQDCKVRVLNVDSQTSLNNIVVQVIGVMSNKSAPSKKFVQTFVLTPQTNGYYVLNDVFRYLNDEEDEIIDDEPEQNPVEAEQVDNEPSQTNNDEQDVVNNEAVPEPLDVKPEEPVETDVAPVVNGTPSEEAVKETTAEETPSEAPEEIFAPVGAKIPAEPEHPSADSPPKPSTPAPLAEVAPSKKTWANLVGSKAAAVPFAPTPVPAAPSQPKAQKSPPATDAQQRSSANDQGSNLESQSNEWQTADHGKKQSRPQNRAEAEGNVLGYIKNVTENIEAIKLRTTLEKYGEIKYFDVSRPRASTILFLYGNGDILT